MNVLDNKATSRVDLRFSRIARDDPNSKKNWPAVGQSLASISSPNLGTSTASFHDFGVISM